MNPEENTQTLEEQESAKWNRLSPVSVVFFLGKAISHLIKDALPGLAPLIVIVANSDNKAWLTVLIVSAVSSLIVLSAILQYWFFRFQVCEDKVLIHQGVFKKKQRILSFERIQNINIIQPFYFKFFSLVTLQLETAGSKGNEADLAGIKDELAEQTKQRILNLKAQRKVPTENLAEEEQQESTDLLATANIKQLIQYGVTSNGMFWFLVFLAPFMGMLDEILEKWIGEENMAAAVEFMGGGIQGGVILAAVVVLSVLFGMVLFSILGSITRYYNYKLNLNDETLKRHSGLLSTHEESAKLSKIQALVNQTNFIGRRLGVENIVLKQASTQTNQNNARAGLFVIPTRIPEQTNLLLKQCLSLETPLDQLTAIDRRYIFKTWLILMTIPLFAMIVITLAEGSWLPFLGLTIAPVLWLIVRQRWKNFGYQISDEFAAFRKGFWGYRKITFPIFKVQRVIISQSILQKRRQLANLDIYMASDKITIPYMPYETAVKWFDAISKKIETTNKSWF